MSRLILDPDRTHAYLKRLGITSPSIDPEGLAALQWAHLKAVPFHNLRLLANDGQPWELPRLEQVVDEAIAGVGGNCDWTTPAFNALLQALGFDATLVAAQVGHPGDHFACVVSLGGERLLCDVGNGQPYVRPWRLDGEAQEQTRHGWTFRFEPSSSRGGRLLRKLPDGRWKQVYTVDPAPREYRDFAAIVASHYTAAGYGPFLTGLRAVQITDEQVQTLRDDAYDRHTRFGAFRRRLVGPSAFRSLLEQGFGLPPGLTVDALTVLARRCPDLLPPPRPWIAQSRRPDPAPPKSRVTREEVPDVLVSLATVGRPKSTRGLLRTLENERRASKYPGRIGVLIVENHAVVYGPPEPPPKGLSIFRVPVSECLPHLADASELGLLPRPTELPVCTASAREAQLAVLREHLRAPRPGLPHPSAHPTVVWMIDDDVRFEQRLDPAEPARRQTNLLFRAARLWATEPTRSVVLGTYTGDPPVPGLDCLGGQLGDIATALRHAHARGPQAPWSPGAPTSSAFDAYYDLSESTAPQAARWPVRPDLQDRPMWRVVESLLGDLDQLLEGRQLVRRLFWDGTEAALRPSLRRGGNTLFLDLDALFRWPAPAVRCADGVTTRRAETLWAALASADSPEAVVEATLPLEHDRAGQSLASAGGGAAASAAQVRGVALARILSQGGQIEVTLRSRERVVRRQRATVLDRIEEVRELVASFEGWGDPQANLPIREALSTLDRLGEAVREALPMPGDAKELEVVAARLRTSLDAWRLLW